MTRSQGTVSESWRTHPRPAGSQIGSTGPVGPRGDLREAVLMRTRLSVCALGRLVPGLVVALLPGALVSAAPGAVNAGVPATVTSPLVTSDNVTLVGNVHTASATTALTFDPDAPIAYVSTFAGPQVYDISNPALPESVATVAINGFTNESFGLGGTNAVCTLLATKVALSPGFVLSETLSGPYGTVDSTGAITGKETGVITCVGTIKGAVAVGVGTWGMKGTYTGNCLGNTG